MSESTTRMYQAQSLLKDLLQADSMFALVGTERPQIVIDNGSPANHSEIESALNDEGFCLAIPLPSSGDGVSNGRNRAIFSVTYEVEAMMIPALNDSDQGWGLDMLKVVDRIAAVVIAWVNPASIRDRFEYLGFTSVFADPGLLYYTLRFRKPTVTEDISTA